MDPPMVDNSSFGERLIRPASGRVAWSCVIPLLPDMAVGSPLFYGVALSQSTSCSSNSRTRASATARSPRSALARARSSARVAMGCPVAGSKKRNSPPRLKREEEEEQRPGGQGQQEGRQGRTVGLPALRRSWQ